MAIAGSMGTIAETYHPVASFGGGFSSTTNLGINQTFPITDPVTQEYYVYKSSQSSQIEGLFEAFLGVERAVYNDYRVQFGVAYDQTGYFSPQGTLIQGADVFSQDQYNYKFRLITRQVLAQAKFMREYKDKLYPYLLAGIGGSINTASNYSTNVPPFLTFTRMYDNNHSSGFAFRVGAGVDMEVYNNWRVGVAYRFAGLGRVSLGNAIIDNIPVSGTLNQANLYANEFLAQISYVM